MTDLTDAYENGKYIPGAANYVARWEADAAAFRALLGARAQVDLAYGPEARHRFDLFLPEADAKGLLVFIHGGYWLKFDKSYWSHLAAGALAHGFAVAMPSYRLAPQSRIAEITRDIAAAVEAAASIVAGAVVVTGHSAGGHLSARMACTAVLSAKVSERLARAVPISPLSDLRPLMRTAMNKELQIDAGEAASESPVLCEPLSRNVTVWVGAEERPAFLDQARWLSEVWPQSVLRIAPGRHHFDVIEDMVEADSPLTKALVAGVV